MDELRIDLAAFQGPLDLLLHLVQQDEVDIYEISISRIADRFLGICRTQVQDLDVDQAGEFLVMASQLLVMKSRALLPREAEVDVEEIDPRLDLVRQLIEYRDFKHISAELEERAAQQRDKRQAKVSSSTPKLDRSEVPLEVDLFILVEAFQQLMRETGDDESVHMPKERLPITHFVGLIFDHLTSVGGKLSFRELIGAKPNRTYVIGAFLALLELMKLHKVEVIQDGLGDMNVRLRAEGLELQGTVDQDLAADTLDHIAIEDAPSGPRVVFMGSPEFAVPSLRSLVGAGFKPLLVVTPPPRQSGRGRRKQEVPVAKEAEILELPLHRTGDVNGMMSRSAIEAEKPDVIITAGFGQKLGSGILEMPKHGCLNVHVSLLPKYRGASPVAAAILGGEKKSGVTIFVMDEKFDRGPIVAQRGIKLNGTETADELTVKLAEVGADLLVRSLGSYLDGELEPSEQDDEKATYVGKLTKEAGVINWDAPASDVYNHIRAMTSWPGAQTAWQPKVKHEPLPLIVAECAPADDPRFAEAANDEHRAEAANDEHRAEPALEGAPEGAPEGVATEAATQAESEGTQTQTEVRPGTVLAATAEGIDVACAEGVVRILRVRPAGGRAMAVKDFLNARRVVAGDRLVTPK